MLKRLAVVLFVFMLCRTTYGDLVLERGKVSQPIVVSNSSTAVELFAAKELQHYFQCIGLGYLPILRDNEFSGHGPAFYVGWSGRSQDLSGLSAEDMSYDESVVCITSAGDGVFVGHPKRGALYAVYRFLEKYCHIRWWSVSEETTRLVTELRVPEMLERFTPSIPYRQPSGSQFVGDKGASRAVASYNARLGNNMGVSVDQCFGPSEVTNVLCRNSHTSERFVPDEAFFKSHPALYGAGETFSGAKPEYFALREGRRLSASEGQPCLSNPEVALVAAENIKKLLRRQSRHYDVVWLTQNDNTKYCQCPACLAEISRLGNRADLNIQFVNRVAELVNQEYPDMAIETFAYQFTFQPPKSVRPSDHVRIRVCLIEADAGHPLTHPNNRKYLDALQGWCAISPNVTIWHYDTNFINYGLVHPFARTLAADIRLFKELGIKDVYTEDADESGQFSWFGVFRGALNVRLLRDAEMDVERFTEDFFRGYYGKAGEPLLALLRLYEDTAASSDAIVTCYQMDTSHWLPLAVLDQGEKFLAEAERVTPLESEYARRVALVRLNQDWTRLWRHENTAFRKLDGAVLRNAEGIARLRRGILERVSAVPRTPGWYNFWTRMGQFTPERHVAKLDGYLAPEMEHTGLPASMSGIREKDLLIIPFERYETAPLGLKTIADYKSPVNQALRLTISHDTIVLRVDMPALANADEWEIILEMRLPDAESEFSGTVAVAGVYDHGTNWESLTKYPITSEQVTSNEYRLVSLGTTDFHRDGQIYIRGCGDTAPRELLIGRIFLRRKMR